MHGLVLAGGMSSRMGTDKALLSLDGVPLVALAVERLRSFCPVVAIVGNRPDLVSYAPVIPERRTGFGPVAGLEAGLAATEQEWVLCTPVDVPLVEAALLRRWAELVLCRAETGIRVSYLRVHGERQPSFCMLHREVLPRLVQCAEAQQKRLVQVLEVAAGGSEALWAADAEELDDQQQPESFTLAASFLNVNTPENWAELHTALQKQLVPDQG